MNFARPRLQSEPSFGPQGETRPHTAMILAAGFGERMRPLTNNLPKPLIQLGGRALIDHVLDRLAAAGVRRAIVNAHYCADALDAHMAARAADGREPAIVMSDERSLLLDTGGGVKKALPLLGSEPFFIHNSDSVWLEHGDGDLSVERLIAAWDEQRMDMLLLLAETATSLGYGGRGDFIIAEDGRLRRRGRDETAPHVFTGASIVRPELFDGAPDGPFSLNLLFDKAIASGGLFGAVHRGGWMHVGTPEALREAEARWRDKYPDNVRDRIL